MKLKSSLLVLLSVTVMAAPLVAEEYDDVISDSDAAVEESNSQIEASQNQIQQYDDTGQLPVNSTAQAAGAAPDASGFDDSDEEEADDLDEETGDDDEEVAEDDDVADDDDEVAEGDDTDSDTASGSTSNVSGNDTVVGEGQGVIYNTSNEIYANIYTKFKLESKDDKNQYESGVLKAQYKVDDDTYKDYSEPIQITIPGPHYIYYRSIDKAGNVEKDKIYKVYIDNKKPSIAITPSKTFYLKGSAKYASPNYEFTMQAQDSESGVAKIQYSINGGAFQDYSGPVKVTNPGQQKLVAVAYDNVGNKSEPFALEWIVDTVKPKVKIKITPTPKIINGKAYVNYKSQFTITAEDNESGVKQVFYKVDNGEWVPYTTPVSYQQEKETTMEAKAVDNVGNESVLDTGDTGVDDKGVSKGSKMVFQVDKLAPETTLTPIAAKVTGQ